MVLPLSRRILNVKSSPTVALNAKAKALAKDGIKVLNFAVGEPDFATPQSVIDVATAALAAGHTKYGPAGGGPEFRKAIAAKLQRENNLTFSPDDIVCGMGAKELLFHIFLALLNEGDEVLVPTPYWVSYPDQVIAAGGKPVFLPMPKDLAKEPFSLADLERMGSSRTVALVLNSPNNPSGAMMSEAFQKELGAFLKARDWWIISDEIYEYLAFDMKHVSLPALHPELMNRYIHVNGMSKGYAMTGWRVGYTAGPSAVMKLVRDLQSHSSTCLPPFIEEAAAFAIAKGPALLKNELALMQRRRDLAVGILRQIPDVSFVLPQGAFYLFIDARQALAKIKNGAMTSMELSEYLLLKQHIALVPGEAFGAPGFLRLSYATDEQQVEDGIKRLGAGLKELMTGGGL